MERQYGAVPHQARRGSGRLQRPAVRELDSLLVLDKPMLVDTLFML